MGNENTTIAYRVVKVKPNSPASALPIEPMLDFLLYPPLEGPEPLPPFDEFINSNEGKEIELSFYNIASQQVWKGRMTPRKWEGEGLLGLTINQEDHTIAHARVVRVLNFFVNSPLHKAGFRSYTDYILGTENYSFNDVEDFTDFIRHNSKAPVDLYVYNSEDQKVRILTLVPDPDWGGAGYLGGDIGFGHLHSLPMRRPKAKEVVAHEPVKVIEKTESPKEEEVKVVRIGEEEKKEAIKVVRVEEEGKKEDVEVVQTEEKPVEVLGVNEKEIFLGEKKDEQRKQEEGPGKAFSGEIMI